ncbi:hypothetical protein FLL45_05410 [Aliikangiella marina]|uniref:ZZ-type domain-containing protein n=1 Tax=Aliikangiella marina TaxID=1712262 RepID=A0A545TJI5_9GAMM|nr:ZZ-type zinc finger protein [Aliikangiella marina]TQV77383.1 hypothetical protein FLL45_05410 [Aliikangiella marina]
MQQEIHFWQHCFNCKVSPIVGTRYQCQTCPAGPNIDLCQRCYALYKQGKISEACHTSDQVKLRGNDFKAYHGERNINLQQWQETPVNQLVTPELFDNFLVRLEFKSGFNSAFGGYGFVVNHNQHTLVLTALHVLDEVLKAHEIDASSNNLAYTGAELPSVIDSTVLYDVMKERWMFHELGVSNQMIALKNARIGELEPISFKDISAFHISEDVQVKAACLAESSPEVGESVWLVANMPEYQNTRQAVVVEKSDKSLIFRYNQKEGIPIGCSGAPIINKLGQVVAINIGTTTNADQRYGHSNPVESIREHLTVLS